MGAIWHPSPNFGPRRDGLRPYLIVLHYTAMNSAQSALDRLCDPEAEVSAHYLISGDGTLWQMVDEKDRAWHAGAGSWQGVEDINSRSIGIELDNRGNHPFSEPQMKVLESLMVQIMGRWNMRASGVIAHSDMAPGRKFDPGPRFDWQRLARQGLAAWPACVMAIGNHPEILPDVLKRVGYPVEAAGYDACLAAFRDRFRPGAEGIATIDDLKCALALARRISIDRASAVS